jgi:hypothetical protein
VDNFDKLSMNASMTLDTAKSQNNIKFESIALFSENLISGIKNHPYHHDIWAQVDMVNLTKTFIE